MSAAVPVLVGIGTATQREDDPLRALEPIDLMIEAAREAGRDAGVATLLTEVGRVLVPKGRWRYGDPGRAIARAIGAENAVSVLATVGVLQQTLIGDACLRIAKGEVGAALVVGGDAGFRILRARICGVEVPSRALEGEPDIVMAPCEELRHPAEVRAGLKMPVGLYAIIDSAFRAAQGRSVEVHGQRLAHIYAQFSQVAAQNPHAWMRKALDPDAIRLPSERNPMQAFPYTKRHCSSWNVDQAAALLFTSESRALALGLDSARFVYPLASTESNHMVPVVARDELAGCPGARVAGRAALAAGGLNLDDLDLVELYSCFPVAVEAFAAELGLSPECSLTVTGGMPFAGGPFNNYVVQATCRMAELLRAGAGKTGLVGSVSGILTKQGFGLWSRDPGEAGFAFVDVTDEVARLSSEREVAEETFGRARVAGYTVIYEGGASRGLVVADRPDGRRALGITNETALVELMEREEFIGREVTFEGDGFRL